MLSHCKKNFFFFFSWIFNVTVPRIFLHKCPKEKHYSNNLDNHLFRAALSLYVFFLFKHAMLFTFTIDWFYLWKLKVRILIRSWNMLCERLLNEIMKKKNRWLMLLLWYNCNIQKVNASKLDRSPLVPWHTYSPRLDRRAPLIIRKWHTDIYVPKLLYETNQFI